MDIKLYCVYHKPEDINEIKKYDYITPYNINECKNGNLNPYICEYICQQNNESTTADYIGFDNVSRIFNKENIENIIDNNDVDFIILEKINCSADWYLGKILCLNSVPEIRDITYQHLAEYGITDIYENNDWARYELYIAKKDAYKGLVKFINGYLDKLFSLYKCKYDAENCRKMIMDNYMKPLQDLYKAKDETIINRIKNRDWFINENSKFYTTPEEELEYTSFMVFKKNPRWKYGNQLHRIIAYIIEYLVGTYICRISKNYYEDTNIIYNYVYWK